MNPNRITSWDFLKDMFRADEKLGIMAYEAKDQEHRAQGPGLPLIKNVRRGDIPGEQRVLTREEALSPEFSKRLKFLNARGLNIIVCANPLKPDATTRSKDSVATIRHLVMDIDTKKDEATGQIVTGKELLDSMLASPDCPQPYYILNTSPDNYQAIWRVTDFSREQAESIQKALGANYGGDRNISTDISRGVRLPGLHNKKYDETFAVTCRLNQQRIHKPEAFAYLPQPELTPSTQQHLSQTIPPDLAATKPYQGEPVQRGHVTHSRQQYSTKGPDQSPSGKDWGYCNQQIGTRMRKEGVGAFETILLSQKAYLVSSAADRRHAKPEAYANTTINKLRTHWSPRLHEYAFQPAQHQTAAGSNGRATHPVTEDPRRPVAKLEHKVDASSEIRTSGKTIYAPTPEDQSQFSRMIRQSLIDGCAPEQIYSTFIEWKLKDVAGAEEYLTKQILYEQQTLRAESLVPHAQLFLDQPPTELEAFRRLLDAQTPGDGVLLTAQRALDQAQQMAGHPPYQPVTGSPANNPDTQAHAMRLATLAFLHGDTPGSVAQALTVKYHPNVPMNNPPQHIAALVQQAQTTQSLALTNQERGILR